MAKLISALVTAVKERASLPANNDRFPDSSLVTLLKEELEDTVVPFMNGLTEEFFVCRELVALQDDSDNPLYPNLRIPIPERAYARILRDVQYVSGSSSDIRSNIPLVQPEDRDYYSKAFGTTPIGFYFENDFIQLIGNSSVLNGSIEFSYYYRVPNLSDEDELYAPISNIAHNTTTDVTTFTADITDIPSGEGMTLSGVGLFDIYRKSTGAYIHLDVYATVAGTGTTATFAATGITEDEYKELIQIQSGSYPVAAPYSADLVILAADLTPFSPVPTEVDNLLVAAVCGRVLEALGDTEGLGANMEVMKRLQSTLTMAYGKRVIGEAKKVINRRGIYNSMRRRGVIGNL